MMPFRFFLKPLLFTKFLLFFHCSDLQVQLVILFFFQYCIYNFDTLLCVAFQRLSSSQCIHQLISISYQTGYYEKVNHHFHKILGLLHYIHIGLTCFDNCNRIIHSYTNYRDKTTSSKDPPTETTHRASLTGTPKQVNTWCLLSFQLSSVTKDKPTFHVQVL